MFREGAAKVPSRDPEPMRDAVDARLFAFHQASRVPASHAELGSVACRTRRTGLAPGMTLLTRSTPSSPTRCKTRSPVC